MRRMNANMMCRRAGSDIVIIDMGSNKGALNSKEEEN